MRFAAHEKYWMLKGLMYMLIQVVATWGDTPDNIVENILVKDINYCELTGIWGLVQFIMPIYRSASLSPLLLT